jgi:hypothetical protein
MEQLRYGRCIVLYYRPNNESNARSKPIMNIIGCKRRHFLRFSLIPVFRICRIVVFYLNLFVVTVRCLSECKHLIACGFRLRQFALCSSSVAVCFVRTGVLPSRHVLVCFTASRQCLESFFSGPWQELGSTTRRCQLLSTTVISSCGSVSVGALVEDDRALHAITVLQVRENRRQPQLRRGVRSSRVFFSEFFLADEIGEEEFEGPLMSLRLLLLRLQDV